MNSPIWNELNQDAVDREMSSKYWIHRLNDIPSQIYLVDEYIWDKNFLFSFHFEVHFQYFQSSMLYFVCTLIFLMFLKRRIYEKLQTISRNSFVSVFPLETFNDVNKKVVEFIFHFKFCPSGYLISMDSIKPFIGFSSAISAFFFVEIWSRGKFKERFILNHVPQTDFHFYLLTSSFWKPLLLGIHIIGKFMSARHLVTQQNKFCAVKTFNCLVNYLLRMYHSENFPYNLEHSGIHKNIFWFFARMSFILWILSWRIYRIWDRKSF